MLATYIQHFLLSIFFDLHNDPLYLYLECSQCTLPYSTMISSAFINLFIKALYTAQVLKVCRTLGPTAC